MHQPHKLADVGSIPVAVTRGDDVTGNIRVSKTFVLGSNPSPLVHSTDFYQYCYCPIAQLVERCAVNAKVTGSSPVGAVRRGRYWQGTLFAKQS